MLVTMLLEQLEDVDPQRLKHSRQYIHQKLKLTINIDLAFIFGEGQF